MNRLDIIKLIWVDNTEQIEVIVSDTVGLTTGSSRVPLLIIIIVIHKI